MSHDSVEQPATPAASPEMHDRIPRRRFLAGMGAAVGAGAAAAALDPLGQMAAGAGTTLLAAPGRRPGSPDPFGPAPTASTTTTEDRQQMLWQLGITEPTLPSRAEDPNAPPNAFPRDPTDPEGDWTDPLGHTVERATFGWWTTYDDDTGLAGGAASPDGAYGPLSWPRYTDIDLLLTQNGDPVLTPEDWWLSRRPELAELVRDNLYGHIPDPALWPAITWSVGPVSTGTANGVAYKDRLVTGTIDTSSYPALRNAPLIQGTLRTPLASDGQAVPVIVTFDTTTDSWEFTAPYGYGLFAYNCELLQPDSGGANLSSYLIGLINKGQWRRPTDWGALAAWGWGISRLIDYFETDPDVDADKIGVQGHSRFGKATLVTAAYDDRVAVAYPSCGGELGTSWARRTWGENFEFTCGADTEYHWVAGNTMRYMGELRPGTYWPRKVEYLPVDVHCVMALLAPRMVLTNGGTDTPPGYGDAWQDPRGMYLAGRMSTPAWNLLGWPGQIIPPGTVFTSGPGESIGGTPPFNVAFIEGNVGWRRHSEGHTPIPDWPAFMQQASRFLNDDRPVVVPGQRFRVEDPLGAVGTVQATSAAGKPLSNWQITGGTGAPMFAISRRSGQLSVVRPGDLGRRSGRVYDLEVIVDDGTLAAHPGTVTIELGAGRR